MTNTADSIAASPLSTDPASPVKRSSSVMTFQEIILNLQKYWLQRGCVLWLPHHDMVGAGTNNPATILRVLGPEPLRIVYTEPSFRPDDGRYGENPNRVQMHHQLQVIIKPIPFSIQQMYLDSLFSIGLDYRKHDIRFVEDNWESPVIGAWGLGWEVWLDGMEVSQYTYFQQAGGLTLNPAACELTYGLERIAMYIQGVDSLWDIKWNENFTYGELLQAQEVEYCRYNFEIASVDRCLEIFDRCEAEALTAIEKNVPIPAYDYVCRCSHLFNILDTRGAVGVAERAKFFARIRNLSRRIAESYLGQRESLGFPLVALTPTDWQQPPVDTESCNITTEKGTLLCELGFEEIAAFVPERLIEQSEAALPKLLTEARLTYDNFRGMVTPRRLAILIHGLSAKQQAAKRHVKGPRKDICDKNPQALEGFCRRNDATTADISWQEEGGVTFAFLTINEPTDSIAQVMPGILAALFDGFNCGRHMRWLPEEPGEKKASFNRPIRSLVTLYQDQVLPWTYAGISSSRTTFGARWQNSPELRVPDAPGYERLLSENQILVDHNERRNKIESSIATLVSDAGGILHHNDALVDEITHLVETPVAFVGQLPEIAKSLPPIVIRAVIEKHVRCFSVYDQDNRPLPLFVGVSNGVAEHIDIVSSGFARVITARLKDADFFIARDKERTLSQYRELLARQTFHEQLGSLLDKTGRVEKIVDLVGEMLGLSPIELSDLRRAVYLSRADLATGMVTEMTSLQGEMGRIYALRDGESETVATALYEQYLPRHAGDECPLSRVGQALSIAHRVDTLTAFLAIGMEPSGSADPFALRREALGLVHTVLTSASEVKLSTLATAALAALAEQLKIPSASDTIERFNDFIAKRLEGILREEGAQHDVVRAVLAVHGDNPTRAKQLVNELEQLLQDARFREVLPAYLRCVRLLKKAAQDSEPIDPSYESVLAEPAEVALIAVLKKVEITNSLPNTAASFAQAASAINHFFDAILVIAPEPNLRAARLGLIKDITDTFQHFARLELVEG